VVNQITIRGEEMKLINNKHTGRCVLINSLRDMRTSDFTKSNKDECPFCPSYQKAEKCLRYEEKIDGEWVTRSIDNKFPALICDEDRHENGEIDYGKHEVMIETPEHFKNFYDFVEEDFYYVIKMYKNRYTELINEDRIESVIIYKNHMKSAGASKVHSHSQILSMSFIPPEIEKEIKMAEKGIFASENNLIYENEFFTVFIPDDAFLSGEIIIKNRKSTDFSLITDNEIESLSEIFNYLFQKISQIYGFIPFNIYIHSLPKGIEVESYKWHIHVIPRKGNFGGFELGTGLYINSLDVEDMTNKFRENKK
jgi:UDPglucose--hexose-1-phosphate uridylyltransferase